MTRAGARGRGDLGEDLACRSLSGLGYELLDRGWTRRGGELDIVARTSSGTIVFVEVKTSYGDGAGDPGQWVTPTKQRRVCRTALAWLAEHDALDREARFDLVLLRPGCEPEHIEDAFPYVED